jgi:membrane protease YdiL (CAAX protease family)
VSNRSALGVAIALLAVHNVAGNLWMPAWSYLPLNVTVGVLLVWWALRSGVAGEDVGGPRSLVPPGLRAGAALGAVGAAVIGIGVLVPAAADLFADDRVLGVGAVGVVYHTLVRIPVGTAVFEEVAFRGVLPALGRRVTSPVRANLLAAGLFGLWHVIPSTSVAAGNDAAVGFADGIVIAAAVVGTAAVGLAFSWMRDRWGLAAPIVVHAVVNSTAFAAAWAMT